MFCFSFYFHVFFVGWGSGLLGSKFDRIVFCLIIIVMVTCSLCVLEKVTSFHSKVNNFILMMKCVWGWLWWGVVVAVVTMVFLFILLLTWMESMSIRRISMQSLWTGGCRDDIFFKNSLSLSLSITHSSICVCACVYYIYVSIYRSIHPSIPLTASC